MAAGQNVYLVLDAQRGVFHLPTRQVVLEEIADAVDELVEDAIGADENSFNPSEYLVSADHILRLTALLQKLIELEEAGT